MQDLSLHLLDLVRNSVRAGATRIRIAILAEVPADLLTLTVDDNGSGMPPEHLETVLDPFSTTRTTRSVGLGLSLLQESAVRTGGRVSIRSAVREGTSVVTTFGLSSIDRPPLGDVGDTLSLLLVSDPDIEYEMEIASGGAAYRFHTGAARRDIPGIPLSDPAVSAWIRDHVNEAVGLILGGILDEVTR